MPHNVGVEIGGTFTDLVWSASDGSLRTGKVPSTPHAVEEAVLRVISEAGVSLPDVEQVTHGSTVATNALLTRRGARAGVLTTAGFRDVIPIGRADRNTGIYDIRFRRPKSPIPRRLIREVPERIDAAGKVLQAIDLDRAWVEVEMLLAEGIEAIAICFLHAYRNPVHEQALADLIRVRAPEIAISTSHEISPEFREYERSLTTAVNAFVGPVVGRYMTKLNHALQADGYSGVLNVMQSNGGTMPAEVAGTHAVRMLLSGPAAGVRAAIWFAERNGIEDVITLDMGGTSTDVAIAPGLKPRIMPELLIDGLPIRTATIDMATIGAGGGSIASIDPGGFLAVGPESAGAVPGPACYDRGGTRPTVTDAQLVAGILRPARFFGGKMVLRPDKAEAALAGLNLAGGLIEAADAVLRLVNGCMAGAARLVSTARGIDPAGFTILAYGGGGPLHAAYVAEEIGIRRVLVPWSPGLTSAFGLLIADTVIDVSESDLHVLSDRSLDQARFDRLAESAEVAAAKNGLGPGTYAVTVGLEMRYAGQAFELTAWTSDRPSDAAELRSLFEAEHTLRYGYARPSLTVEVVGYRTRIVRSNLRNVRPPIPSGTGQPPEQAEVSMGGQRLTATFVSRDSIAVGAMLAGPAIVEEPTSTTTVPPGWRLTCLPTGDLLLEDTR